MKVEGGVQNPNVSNPIIACFGMNLGLHFTQETPFYFFFLYFDSCPSQCRPGENREYKSSSLQDSVTQIQLNAELTQFIVIYSGQIMN